MPPSWPGVTIFDHQLSGSAWMAFWLTMVPVLPCSDHAARHQPQALESVILTVFASGALRPLIWNAGSLDARWVSMFCRKDVWPALFFLDGADPAAFWTASNPAIALRFDTYAPCNAT